MKPQPANTAMIPDSLTQSFFSPAHIIYRKGEIVLGKSILKGRIIIQSDSAIIVDGQCKLDNIILIAPRIWFKEGFRGRVQSFASQEIIAADNCSFLYPSCLILQGRETAQQTRMQLGQNCSLEGMLMSLSRTEVDISPGSIISGVVYTNGHTVLQGKVNGIVLTDFFRYRSATAEYENYLADAEINRSGLSPWFIAPPIFSPSSPRKVMTWLE